MNKFEYKYINDLKIRNYSLFAKSINKDFYKIRNSVLRDMVELLNSYHKKNYSIRQWQIIIGNWLDEFLRIYFFYKNFLQYFRKNQILKKKISKPARFVIPTNFISFIELTNSKNFFYNFLYLINQKNNKLIKSSVKKTFFEKKKNLKTFILCILNYLNKNNKTLLFSSRFKFINQINIFLKSRLKIMFFPYLERLFKTKNILVKNKRGKILKKIKRKKNYNLLKLIFNFFPSYYLETFQEIDKINIINFKKNNSIYSDVNFIDDEVFKIIVAKNLPKKLKIFIGQHGGNFLLYNLSNLGSNELSISDNYLSWGNLNIKKKIKHLSSPRLLEVKKKYIINYNKKFDLCYILKAYKKLPYQAYFYRLDNFKYEINEIKKFKKKLNKEIVFKGYPEENRYSDQINNSDIARELEVDYSRIFKNKNIIYKSKLLVFNYISTMIFEILNQNIPFILILDININNLSKEGKLFVKTLKKNKLFFDNHEDAIKFLNKTSSFDKWWNDNNHQKAMDRIRKKYARISKNYINEWIKFYIS